ncbi:3-oxoacyl-ACP synthase [Pseudomonas syringae]|uniref:3-oxoacyl-ACP synthase n=1 Tax=Pseudomonas syringae TaxID=317 RepID=A0A0L1MM07_PSESX|nr:3-oxoacyl-ACP synthase [Pseudomonas syringae]
MTALCIIGSGMVSAVGLSAPASCAAIRCAIDNFQETRFIDQGGEWLIAASVPLEQPWRGRTKLIKMAARAIAEALQSTPCVDPEKTPLLLGVAEADRPGRLDGLDGLDNGLLHAIEAELGLRFHPSSNVIARGRVSAAVALLNARTLIYQGGHHHVLIAGVDSFLNGPTLAAFEARERLLTRQNSNGFIPGEGAAAVVLAAPVASEEPQLACIGLGFGMEKATVEAENIPLRADGLTQAVRAALSEAGCGLEQMDYRLTDISGEQYYFKEASLALSRSLRVRKEFFHLWHPADCIGEVGAAIGPAMLAVALAASRKGYGEGPNIFCHLGNDAGERAAAMLSYQTVRAA